MKRLLLDHICLGRDLSEATAVISLLLLIMMLDSQSFLSFPTLMLQSPSRQHLLQTPTSWAPPGISCVTWEPGFTTPFRCLSSEGPHHTQQLYYSSLTHFLSHFCSASAHHVPVNHFRPPLHSLFRSPVTADLASQPYLYKIKVTNPVSPSQHFLSISLPSPPFLPK